VRGTPLTARTVIAAVDWHGLAGLFPTRPEALRHVFDAAASTPPAAILAAHLWLDRPVMEVPFLGLPGRPWQWIFDAARQWHGRSNHLSLVASAADELAACDRDALVTMALETVRDVLPAARTAVVRQAVVVRPAYGPYYYGGFYDPFFWGYPGWYPYGFYAPAYGGVYGHPTGSARLQVTPKQAEVYVDGYLAGTVDDFDGFLQRLDVPAGEHELTLYLPGYRTIRQTVLFRPGATVKISTAMEQLGQGAADEPRPRPNPDAAPPEPEAGRNAQPARESDAQSAFGTLSLRVQPRDAAILVDGEEWQVPESAGLLTLELGSGAHQVEVRKQGFTSYRSTVQVRAGETVALNVSLAR